MKLLNLSLLGILLYVSCLCCAKYEGVPADVDIDEKLLPDFLAILEEAGMSDRLNDLVRMGVVDTRVLLRLKQMDFQMMQFEWAGMTTEMVDKFMEVAGKYAVQATQNARAAEVPTVDYTERDMQRFGRLVLPNGVQSYEYVQGSFGGRPHVGLHELVVSEPDDACPPGEDSTNLGTALPELATSDKYKDKLVVARRGQCPFLRKAEYVAAAGAAGIIVVNSVDNLEAPSSGAGIDSSVTDARLAKLAHLSVVAVANTTWAPLQHALSVTTDHKQPLFGQTIPIRCGAQGYCSAVFEEEMNVPLDTSAGLIRVTTPSGESKAFDFLTSTFGSYLLSSSMEVVVADPVHGCEATSIPKGTKDFVLVTHRGACRFDQKAIAAEKLGAKVLIVVEVGDNALQRLGAAPGVGDTIGIPAIIITAAAGEYIESAAKNGAVSVVVEPSDDKTIAEAWIDLAFTEFHETMEEALSQLEGLALKYEGSNSLEIVSWLKKKAVKVRGKHLKLIETDATSQAS